jgi:hypothetical protein
MVLDLWLLVESLAHGKSFQDEIQLGGWKILVDFTETVQHLFLNME